MATLRRKRPVTRKIMKKAVLQKHASIKSKVPRKPRRNKAATISISPQASVIAGEMAVKESNYFHSRIWRVPYEMPQELPAQYGRDMLTVLVRDPRWIFCFWEVTGGTIENFKRQLGGEFEKAKMVLRAYDVSGINFTGSNANRFFDVSINKYANNWYIETGAPDTSWCVDLGLILTDGSFITILRSNIVRMPSEGASDITDEEWMIPDWMFARLYGMGFGLGRSSPVGKAWQERMKQVLSSGIPGSGSMASPVKQARKARKFWMMVDCELIVYGATEPDARVTVHGKPVKLRPDGSFTFRYVLPDGIQIIPVKAVSSDGIEERSITPVVERNTR